MKINPQFQSAHFSCGSTERCGRVGTQSAAHPACRCGRGANPAWRGPGHTELHAAQADHPPEVSLPQPLRGIPIAGFNLADPCSYGRTGRHARTTLHWRIARNVPRVYGSGERPAS
jgi:hypothetical protein